MTSATITATRGDDVPKLQLGRYASFHIHSFILTFFSLFLHIIYASCSHTQVFRKILVQELHNFCSYSEWNLLVYIFFLNFINQNEILKAHR